jgi:hypothetical protein
MIPLMVSSCLGHHVETPPKNITAPLTLRLHGDSQGPQLQQALIQMHCDEMATEVIPYVSLALHDTEKSFSLLALHF